MTGRVNHFVRDLLIAINIYESKIEAMQGKTFYCEDEDGVLRRWTPPRCIKVNKKYTGKSSE